jgi:hypothetical protein
MSVSDLNEFVADLAREEIGAGPIETVRGGDELQASDARPGNDNCRPDGPAVSRAVRCSLSRSRNDRRAKDQNFGSPWKGLGQLIGALG